MWPPKSIDLICLGFVVNGGRCQHNWKISRCQHNWSMAFPHFFILYFYLLKKFYLSWLSVKFLKDLLEEDSPIVAPEISHILFTDFIFLLYLSILKVSCV